MKFIIVLFLALMCSSSSAVLPNYSPAIQNTATTRDDLIQDYFNLGLTAPEITSVLPKNGISTEFVALTMQNALLESLTLFTLFLKQLVRKIIHVLSKTMSLKLMRKCVQNVPK